jgi:hypothetical protein
VLSGQLADMTFCDPPYNVDYANSPRSAPQNIVRRAALR